MPHQCTTCGHVFADGSKEMLSGCPDCGGNKFQFRPSGSLEQFDDSQQGEKSSTRQSESPGQSASPSQSTPTSQPAQHSAETGRIPDDTDKKQSVAEPRAGDSFDYSAQRESSPKNADASAEPASETTSTDSHPLNDADIVTGTVESEIGEDSAQADARSGVVSKDELPLQAARNSPSNTDHTSKLAGPARGNQNTREQHTKSETPETGTEQEENSPTPPEQQGEDHTSPESPPSETAPDESDTTQPDLEDLREELNSQFESIKIVSQGQYELNLMELYDRQEYIISLQEDGRYVIEMPDAWGADET